MMPNWTPPRVGTLPREQEAASLKQDLRLLQHRRSKLSLSCRQVATFRETSLTEPCVFKNGATFQTHRTHLLVFGLIPTLSVFVLELCWCRIFSIPSLDTRESVAGALKSEYLREEHL